MPRLLLSCSLVSLLAAPALAQQAQPRRIQARGVQLRVRPGALGGRRGVMIVANPQVQKELKLTDEQTSKLNDARQKLRQANRKTIRALRGLQGEERRKKQQEIREKGRQAVTAFEKTVAGILDDGQRQRLEEIQIQLAGVRALERESVRQKLKLDDAQQKTIRSVLGSRRERRQKLVADLRNGKIQRQDLRKKLQELQDGIEKDALDVLSEAQKQQFEELAGEKFELQRPRLQAVPAAGQPARIRIQVRPARPRKAGDT